MSNDCLVGKATPAAHHDAETKWVYIWDHLFDKTTPNGLYFAVGTLTTSKQAIADTNDNWCGMSMVCRCLLPSFAFKSFTLAKWKNYSVDIV